MKHVITALFITATSFQVFADVSLKEMKDATLQFKTSPALEMQFDKPQSEHFESIKIKEDGIKYRAPYFKALRQGRNICLLGHTEKLNTFDPDYAKKEPIFQARLRDQKPLTLDPSRTWTVGMRSIESDFKFSYVRLESQKSDGSLDKINMRCYVTDSTGFNGTPLQASEILALFKSKGMTFMKDGKPLKIAKPVPAKPEPKAATKDASCQRSADDAGKQ